MRNLSKSQTSLLLQQEKTGESVFLFAYLNNLIRTNRRACSFPRDLLPAYSLQVTPFLRFWVSLNLGSFDLFFVPALCPIIFAKWEEGRKILPQHIYSAASIWPTLVLPWLNTPHFLLCPLREPETWRLNILATQIIHWSSLIKFSSIVVN